MLRMSVAPHALVEVLDRWDLDAVLEDAAGLDRPAPDHASTNILCVPHHVHERHEATAGEDGQDDAVVRQMGDRSVRLVDVVEQEHVSLVNLLEGEVRTDRIGRRCKRDVRHVLAVHRVDRRAVVVLLTDDGRSSGALDRSFTFLDRRLERALDHVEGDGIDLRLVALDTLPVCVGPRPLLEAERLERGRRVLRLVKDDRFGLTRGRHRGPFSSHSRFRTRWPYSFAETCQAGSTTRVESYCSMIAGPCRGTPEGARTRS